jgi:hypothetical protein
MNKTSIKYRLNFSVGTLLALLIFALIYGGFRRFQKSEDYMDLYLVGAFIALLTGASLLMLSQYKRFQIKKISNNWLYLSIFVSGIVGKVFFTMIVFIWVSPSDVYLACKESFGEALPTAALVTLMFICFVTGFKHLKTSKEPIN